MFRGKKYQDSAKLIDNTKLYDPSEALDLVVQTAKAKFDETIEVHIRLGVDSRHADQQVRGAVVLPNGTGKTKKVLVFAKGDKAAEAEAARQQAEAEAAYAAQQQAQASQQQQNQNWTGDQTQQETQAPSTTTDTTTTPDYTTGDTTTTPDYTTGDATTTPDYSTGDVTVTPDYGTGDTTTTPDYTTGDTTGSTTTDSSAPSASDYTGDVPQSDASSSDSLRQSVVNYALQFVGNPYVYGGTSLTNGTDCSGFTQSVLANFGISISRTAASQSGGGTAVDMSNLQPGDLLFYDNGSGIGHVSMYIGNGQVVHASNEQTGIIVSSVDYRTACAARSYF